MSCAIPLHVEGPSPSRDERSAEGASRVRDTLELVAALVEDARAARWSRCAELVLDLTGAMAVQVVDEPWTEAPMGTWFEVLRPAPDVRVVVSFATDVARAAAAPHLRAIDRIVGSGHVAGAATRPAGAPVDAAILALPLSPRMRDVARLVVAGRSDKEIAVEIGVSYASARSYVQRMCRALGVSGRGGVLRRVLAEGATGELITPPAASSRRVASGRAAR